MMNQPRAIDYVQSGLNSNPELSWFVIGKTSENALHIVSQTSTRRAAMRIADSFRKAPSYQNVVSIIVGKA